MKKLHAIAAWIQQETSARRPRLDKTGVVMRTASVLLLLLPGREGPELLFEVRSSRLGWQPGDICFPGGRRENSDRNFAAAAVREASEELGIPYGDIRLCGTLDFFAAHNGFMVYPFVGIWNPAGGVLSGDAVYKTWNFNKDEVAELFTVPLSWFLKNKRHTFRSPARMIFPLNWYPIWIPTKISIRSMKFTFTSTGIR